MQALERDNIRLAATVMLIRDTTDGLQVYMVKRPGKGAFPDLHVFPGGKVDADDFAPDVTADLDDAQASKTLGISAGGIRYWVAVVRECFEECGVLIVNQAGAPLNRKGLMPEAQLADKRTQILSGELIFSEFLRNHDLTVACNRLAYFSHWLTPESAPRRFDTRFFLAAMPSDQEATADTDETAGEHWIEPTQALEMHQQGHWQMIEPTIRSLQTLSQYSFVEQALAAVQEGNHLMPLTPELQQQGMQTLR